MEAQKSTTAERSALNQRERDGESQGKRDGRKGVWVECKGNRKGTLDFLVEGIKTFQLEENNHRDRGIRKPHGINA